MQCLQVGRLRLGLVQDRLDGADEVAPDGAAEAAVVQQRDGLGRARRGGLVVQQLVVDAYLPDLVLDHRELPPMPRAQDVVQQRRLAAAEEAGQHRDGHLHYH